MNKKKLIVVLLGIAVLITGCGGGRDLSTPTSRLVGHWGYVPIEGEDSVDLEEYFGELNEDGIGSYTFVGLGGETVYAQYRVISDGSNDPTDGRSDSLWKAKETVTIILFIEPSPATYEVIYKVAEDGQTLFASMLTSTCGAYGPTCHETLWPYLRTYFDSTFSYIDSKTEP